MDGLNHAALEDQVLQSGFHAREHVDTKTQSSKKISRKVQSLEALAGGIIDDHRDCYHRITAQTQAAELLTWQVQ